MSAPNVFQRDQQGRAQPGQPLNLVPPPSPFLGVIPAWMWDAPKKLWTMPFTAITNLAGAASTTCSFQVDANYWFVAYYGCNTTRANAAGKAIQASYPLTIALATQSNELFQPATLTNDINNLLGTAAQPSVWALPMILEPTTTLTATIANTGATAVDVALMFMGFLVHKKYFRGDLA